MSNKILVVATCAAIIAVPTFAHPKKNTVARDAASAYAQAIGPRSNVVIEGDNILGEDPDANIRLQLRRIGINGR
jgi:hypothetical protein